MWSEVPNIFRTYFSVQKTLVLSFVDVVFSKGGFLDYKNDILNIFPGSKVKLSYLDRLAGEISEKAFLRNASQQEVDVLHS